jgi:hypothetical protein
VQNDHIGEKTHVLRHAGDKQPVSGREEADREGERGHEAAEAAERRLALDLDDPQRIFADEAIGKSAAALEEADDKRARDPRREEQQAADEPNRGVDELGDSEMAEQRRESDNGKEIETTRVLREVSLERRRALAGLPHERRDDALDAAEERPGKQLRQRTRPTALEELAFVKLSAAGQRKAQSRRRSAQPGQRNKSRFDAAAPSGTANRLVEPAGGGVRLGGPAKVPRLRFGAFIAH